MKNMKLNSVINEIINDNIVCVLTPLSLIHTTISHAYFRVFSQQAEITLIKSVAVICLIYGK